MEVLVTGGNGFVGRHLVRALMARGDRVRVLALAREDAQWLEAEGATVHRGDVCRPETLTPVVRGVDAVVHLAAMMHVWRPLADYRAVNVQGTENVCRAALDSGVHRLVHMSSTSVYGTRVQDPVSEGAPLAPFPDPYPVTKAEGDLVVRRMVAERDLPAVIIRPDQIFGPGDRLHFGHMAARLRAGRAIVAGSGDNALPLVYVSDVVQGLLLSLDDERAIGEAINISNDGVLTQWEFLAEAAAALGVAPPKIHLPFWALYATASVAERLTGLAGRGRRPPVTRLGASFLARDFRVSIAKARRLGYTPQVDLRQGVRLTAEWYLSLAEASAAPAGRALSHPAGTLGMQG